MTFRSDLDQASSAIERAIALNDSMQAERQRIRDALNKAIVVIGSLALFGVVFSGAFSVADEAFRKQGLERQEQISWRK
jgi:hypothetical protein